MYFENTFPPAYGVTPDPTLINRPEAVLTEERKQALTPDEFTREAASAVARRAGLRDRGQSSPRG